MSKIEDGYTIWARQTIESNIFFYKSDKWFKIWFYIVNKVFHTEGKLFNRGEALITYEEIMKATKASKQQVKDCIHYLEKEHMIESKQTTRGKIRKVVNYEIYQDGKNYKNTNRPPNRPLADHQQTPPYIDKNERMKEQEYIYKNKLSKEEKEKIQENLKGKTLEEVGELTIKAFNFYLGTKYKDSKSFLKNMEKWLAIYTLEDIENAIKQIKYDSYWGTGGKGENGMTPVVFFRHSNGINEVNWIDTLLNSKKERK